MEITSRLKKMAELVLKDGVTVNSEKGLIKKASDMKIAILLAKINTI